MLLRIERRQVRIGMYVQEVEGDWIDLPLWFRGCRIGDAATLARMRDSRISTLVIDLGKGVGPAETTPFPALRPPLSPAPAAARVPPSPDLEKARATLRRTNAALRQIFRTVHEGRVLDPAQTRAIVDEVAAAMRHRPGALLGITRLKSKDEYSFLHSVAVCALMTHFARFLRLDPVEVQHLGMAGLLHDIGKLTLPEGILGKPEALSEEETRIVRTHPPEGFRLLAGQDVPDVVREVCLHHHERMDGAGYPDGLAGDQLSRAVRMAAICDVYDAVTSVRPYKEAWSAKTAYRRMWSWEGHFDRVLLGQFFRSIGVAGEAARQP
ncbi:HD-GYP domain-containing protein [Aureimonas flava]|uniref:HD-GYP domain-containing protein n=1 Tax=Aureimonas flava TaxID=2320271 RepID=A0A3A1WRD1_9HYPH|nr:HD-GYP domain-containing protein [Aureimonas flava]RIY02790.1 HD-GYP domain-containing protein [Aureimonas flava]